MSQFNNIDYAVLEPIFNKILFDSTEKPDFTKGKVRLSNEFLKIFENNEKDLCIIETHIENRAERVLKEFDEDKKVTIIRMILINSNYLDYLKFEYILKNADFNFNNNNLIEEKIISKIGDYLLLGEVNNYIKKFFFFYFGGLFYYEFKSEGMINENEYLELRSKCLKYKTLIKPL